MAAVFEKTFIQNLQGRLIIRYCPEIVFSKDNLSNEITVKLYNGESEYSGGGTVSATVIRADGRTVPLTGTITGNVVSLALIESCMEVPGQIQIFIRLTSGNVKTTVFAGVFTAVRTETDTVIDPGTIIPSVTDLINQIDAAIDSIPADYSTLLGSLAGTYSASKTYAVGDYVWYDGALYRCTTAITTAESWTAAHWSRAVLGDDVTSLKSAIDQESIVMLESATNISKYVGVSAVFDLNKAITFANGYYSNNTPVEIVPVSYQLASTIYRIGSGRKLAITVPTGFRVYVQPFNDDFSKASGGQFFSADGVFTTGTNYIGFIVQKNPYSISDTISPSDAAGFEFVYTVTSDANNLTQKIEDLQTASFSYKGSLSSSDNIDTFITTGAYYVPLNTIQGTLPTNLDTNEGTIGLIMIMGVNNIRTQYLVQCSTGNVYTRSEASANSWSTWFDIKDIKTGVDNLETEVGSKALVYKRSLDAATENLDTIIENGAFYVPLNTISGTLPEHLDVSLGGYGLLMVMGTNYLKWQYLIQLATGNIYTRTETAANSWTAWFDEKTAVQGKAELFGTRNVWPFASNEQFTNSKMWGVIGTDILPAGHYTMSFDITAQNTVTWYVYSGTRQEASSTFDPSTGKAVFAFTASNPIQRIFLNTTGNVSMSNIQLEILNWTGYDMSHYNWGLKPLSYANKYIEQESPVDIEAREYPSNWVGKKINYNGDSVTQATGTGYVKVVNQLLRFGTVRNYAIGGTRLAHVEGIPYSMIDRYQDMDADADVIFIMANTNDYASQVPLGSEDSTDINTYNGALNVLMNWLKTTYPTQPIIISTMLTRKVNLDPSTGEPLPIPIEDYAECVRKRTLEHHLILYDAYNLSGMDLRTSPTDGTGITNDGLHPNDAGALSLGRKIAAFINAQ